VSPPPLPPPNPWFFNSRLQVLLHHIPHIPRLPRSVVNRTWNPTNLSTGKMCKCGVRGCREC